MALDGICFFVCFEISATSGHTTYSVIPFIPSKPHMQDIFQEEHRVAEFAKGEETEQ